LRDWELAGCHVTLWDRSEMIVPNKEFITSKRVNWTLSNPETRVDVKVGVADGSALELLRKVLFEVAAANPHVLKEPPADVFLMAFADSSINFELRAFVMFETGKLKVADQLYRAVDDEFNKHGIVIAFPQLDVHVDTGPAGLPK
jgi:potassium efflux system protein